MLLKVLKFNALYLGTIGSIIVIFYLAFAIGLYVLGKTIWAMILKQHHIRSIYNKYTIFWINYDR